MQRQPEEDLEELRKKVQLIEGDRKVYFHESQKVRQKNREKI